MSRPLLKFGGGSGDILRDLLHLRSVFEAEALISGAEGRDQLRHISMSLQAPEPLGRFDAGGDPAQCRSVTHARTAFRASAGDAARGQASAIDPRAHWPPRRDAPGRRCRSNRVAVLTSSL